MMPSAAARTPVSTKSTMNSFLSRFMRYNAQAPRGFSRNDKPDHLEA
jgi:hypothetical protein